ncbi:MAG TPA: acyl-CoA desaturase [Polyangiales bacterium]|nr:acyl-CoA desaturase [Polyangiales bacterium]
MEIAVERRARGLGDYFHMSALPFWLLHVLAVVGIFVWGWSWSGFALAIALYYARMFFVTGVYHRYFSHRAYKTSRWFQFVIALLGGMSVQKGALWWAGHHRHHHKFSDQPEDLHSVRQDGLAWSHVGWIVSRDHNDTRYDLIRDFAKYPELVWLNKHHTVPPILYGVLLLAIGGGQALFWGLVVSTVLLWHGTFTINSLSHVYGTRRFETEDDSRNNWFLAMLTMGEGWHNNHHHYQSTANQGFYWWEVDLSYYVLWTFARVGLVWDLRKPPERVLAEGLDRRPKEVKATAAIETAVAPDAAL